MGQFRSAVTPTIELKNCDMPKVTFTNQKNQKQTVDVPEGSNLRKEALKNGVELYPPSNKVLNCHGFGLCTLCKVHVKKSGENLSQPGFWEKLVTRFHPVSFFERIGHEEELRLACQASVSGDCEVEITPPMNLTGEKFWE